MSLTGIIINNIGSPRSANPDDVGRYLSEFLMDKEIINFPYPLRYAFVNWLIVPQRKFASAQKYKKVWGKTESPLLELTKSFTNQMQDLAGPEYIVRVGMRYDQPSIENAVREMKEKGVKVIYLAPMYPQYARASTFSAVQKTKDVIQEVYGVSAKPDFQTLKPFFNDANFIELSQKKLSSFLDTKQWDHVLFSFHSLPEAQVKRVSGCLQSANCCDRVDACELNCYRAQCVSSARQIAQKAGLLPAQYSISFQSRLGPAKWIQPASIDVVPALAKQGVRRLLVQSPSFVTDCLETLEEISMELHDEFKKHGGQALKLVPCLNDDADWVQSFTHFVQNQLQTKKNS